MLKLDITLSKEGDRVKPCTVYEKNEGKIKGNESFEIQCIGFPFYLSYIFSKKEKSIRYYSTHRNLF